MSAVPDSLKLEGARFVGRSLRGARFIDSDLSHVRARGVLLDGADFDSPWLLDGEGSLVVNGVDVAFFASTPPPYEEVLAVRSERLAQVREFLASVDDAGLDEERRHPWSPEYPETVRSCFHVILEEEWEHLRYALRDLDALDDVAAQGR